MAARKPRDPKGAHIRVYKDLLDSPAWRSLGLSARALFVDLRAAVNGTNNGNIAAPLSVLKHRGWRASATLAAALYGLRALGFIAVTREGGLRQGGRVPTLYRFTDLEVYDQPKVGVQACTATHDYGRFKTIDDAKRALKDGVKRLKEEGVRKQAEKKSPVQKLNRTDSEIEPVRAFSSSDFEQGPRLPVQILNRGNFQ